MQRRLLEGQEAYEALQLGSFAPLLLARSILVGEPPVLGEMWAKGEGGRGGGTRTMWATMALFTGVGASNAASLDDISRRMGEEGRLSERRLRCSSELRLVPRLNHERQKTPRPPPVCGVSL